MAPPRGVDRIDFLTVDVVRAIHARGLADWGGQAGVRDAGGLESAVAQPCATFGGEYLHATIWEMAAAYAFYIAERQPFLDGNKRAGGMSAVTFLALNGLLLRVGCDPEIYCAMIDIAKKQLTREGLAALLESLAEAH